MYTKYTYIPGSSMGNILNDVVDIFTGETNTANLSANCDTANTTITATVAAGWTVHDAAAGSNQVVIKAPHQKNAALFKYALIDCSTSGRINVQAYETWDEVAHTGTNPTGNDLTTQYQEIELTNGGELYLWSNARFLAFAGYQDGIWGSSSGGGVTIVTEYNTNHVWSTTTVPDVAVIYFVNAPDVWLVKAMDIDGIWRYGANATAYTRCEAWISSSGSGTSNFPIGPNHRVPDGVSGEYIPLIHINIARYDVFGAELGNCSGGSAGSGYADFWLVPQSLLGHKTPFAIGVNNYIAVEHGNRNIGNQYRIAFRAE